MNTIQDAINDKYFGINFYTIDESSNRIDYSFNNLKDAYNGSRGTAITYIDDNGYCFTPITFSNNTKLSIDECECTIHITNEDKNKEIYFNLKIVNEEHKLVIKDLNDIILNKDEICELNENYGLYKSGEEVTFSIKFFSGLCVSLNIHGIEYIPNSIEAWKPEYIKFIMPDHDVTVIPLINDCAGDDIKLSETLEWRTYITDENLDYIDIQERFIGVAPEYEYGKTTRIYNEDNKISSWFNIGLVREQRYVVAGGSGYVITFTLKDQSTYVLNVFNDEIYINGKYYYIVGKMPYFLTKSFDK